MNPGKKNSNNQHFIKMSGINNQLICPLCGQIRSSPNCLTLCRFANLINELRYVLNNDNLSRDERRVVLRNIFTEMHGIIDAMYLMLCDI